MQRRFEGDLQLLLLALPKHFKPLLQHCLEALPSIISLPMVLLHNDPGRPNILVDATTCDLTGVIDRAEAGVGPFGPNMYLIEAYMGKIHLRNGTARYNNYEALNRAFWETLEEEVGEDWSDGIVETIKSAMALGLFLSRVFTSRLANMPDPVPIRDAESGAYIC